MSRFRTPALLVLFAGLGVWLRWIAGVSESSIPAPAPTSGSTPSAPTGTPSAAIGRVELRDAEPHARRGEAAPTAPVRPTAVARVRRGPEDRAQDAELAILEEEAARAALRRGLRADSAAASQGPLDPDAERRSLSDELLIDHLVSDTYRTTLFPPETDAVTESRTAARLLLASLPAEERRQLLRAALDAETGPDRPVYQAVAGASAE